MTDVVVFAEEPSGRIVAEALAQNLGLRDRARCIEHQGKSDLELSFPRKMRAWGGHPRFIVMRDNDGADCVGRKASLARLVPEGVRERVKLRLVMQELESWYFGDPGALLAAGLIDVRRAQTWSKQKKHRHPDLIRHAKEEFRRVVGAHGQMALARMIGPHLAPDQNASPSFRAFVGALRWAANP